MAKRKDIDLEKVRQQATELSHVITEQAHSLGDKAAFIVIQPASVCSKCPLRETPAPVKKSGRSDPMGLQAVRDLLLRLAQMDMEHDLLFPAVFTAPLQVLGRNGIGCMGSDCRKNPGIIHLSDG